MIEPGSVRVAVVDDEPLARRGVIQLLAAYPEAVVVGEAGDAMTALPLIEKQKPDIVFLDIEMPGVSGLELATLIDGPLVVFVTAYDAYAVAAFEARALDYLLKPVDPARFDLMWSEAMARRSTHTQATGGLDQEALQDLLRERGAPTRLVLRTGEGLVVVPLETLVWVEAADNYVELHTRDGRHLWRHSLAALETQIGPAGFVRVHRSALVRVAEVSEVRTGDRGDFVVVMSSGAEVSGSRRYRQKFLAALEN